MAELPKGDSVDKRVNLTSDNGVGSFLCSACALFEREYAQGGRTDA